MNSRVIGKKIRIRNVVSGGSFDTVFLVLVMTLLTIGLVMMFSASYVNASYLNGSAFFYIKKQAKFAVVGIILMLAVSRVKYTVYKRVSYAALGISFVLLVLVLLFPAEIEGKEAFKRWLDLPLLLSFQPSEIGKLALILFFARDMEKNQKKIDTDWKMMIPYLIVIGTMCLLVYMENHLSGTLLVLGLGVVMTYLGGVKKGWFIAMLAVMALFAFIYILEPDKVIKLLENYAGDRITAWREKDKFETTLRWQTNQSLYAIGSGGLFGLGLGNSKQKHLYMPEPQNDFVFSIVCEELGFIGAVIIILLFAALVWRGFVIAMRAKDRFSALMVMGIIMQIGLQTALNIFVVTDTVPNTGISLPFFSYGGTALVMLLGEMGMVLSVSRYSKVTKK